MSNNNDQDEFKPFIPANTKLREFTVTSAILGMLMAVLFGAANAYLGLRVGMTVSASIPAAVISMGIIRVILKRDSILENNMVQTIGSAGESVAAGAIFTLPALFLWAQEWGEAPPSMLEIFLITFSGGALGVLFMVPLRKALIVKERKTLPYPEGKACAEVLLAGEKKGSGAATVFSGLGLAAVYKFITDGLKIFPSEVHFEFNKLKGSGAGVDVLPALAGVGYICGAKISSYMFCGGILGWLVIMPLLALFGQDQTLYPAAVPVSEMSSSAIWSSYVRYIGAGAVAAGGLISLLKSMPMILETFTHTFKDVKGGNKGADIRTEQDIPAKIILALSILLIVIIWLAPPVPVSLVGAVAIAVFGFLFSAVASRLVGLVGSSNSPVSGMSIATLLFATWLLKSLGNTGHAGMVGAMGIGAVICVIAAISGDTSQDLKTGNILGATPKKQQWGELLGVLVASLAIGGILFLLNKAWGYGSPELPALQANLMKLVVEGVMDGNLPWTFVISGAFIAVVLEIMGIPVLPFAVGLYLPIHLSAGIMAGGLVRLILEKRKASQEVLDRGVLYTSGLIAGEGVVGILLAVFAVIQINGNSLGDILNLSETFSLGNAGSIIFFLLLLLSIFWMCIRAKTEKNK